MTPEEKTELQAEAERRSMTMSALVRMDITTAKELRERETLKRQLYPQRCVDDL
jgi:hypothetical protein